MAHKITAFIIAALVPAAFANAALKVAPAKNETVSFERTYSVDYLKNHPLQLVTKTSFTLSSKGAKIIGTWKATFRDIVTDESFDAKATATCNRRSKTQVECHFGAREGGTVIVSAKNDSILLSIGTGHGVAFYQDAEKKSEPGIYTEMLIGSDDDNNLYLLYPKKTRY
jgi:hypothetical protein